MTNAPALLEPPTKYAPGLQPGVPLRLRGLSWNDYLAMSEIIGTRRLRTTFCDGELEIMPISSEHEIWTALLGLLIEALTVELKMTRKSLGMTTFRREDIEKGLEPDRCYYLVNEPRVRGKRKIDLSDDPPPDLAIEVEITCSAEKRMRVYAGLGVPEVWRFDGKSLTVNQRVENGEYIVTERSRFFPFLPMNELVRFVHLHDTVEETALVESFRIWLREQIATGWPINVIV